MELQDLRWTCGTVSHYVGWMAARLVRPTQPVWPVSAPPTQPMMTEMTRASICMPPCVAADRPEPAATSHSGGSCDQAVLLASGAIAGNITYRLPPTTGHGHLNGGIMPRIITVGSDTATYRSSRKQVAQKQTNIMRKNTNMTERCVLCILSSFCVLCPASIILFAIEINKPARWNKPASPNRHLTCRGTVALRRWRPWRRPPLRPARPAVRGGCARRTCRARDNAYPAPAVGHCGEG